VTKPTEEILLNEQEPKEIDARGIACHMRRIIKLIGEDPNREGLRKTPERFEKALKVSDQRLPPEPGPCLEWRDVQRGLRRDGDRQGHRILSASANTTCCRSWQGSRGLLPDKLVLGLSKIARVVNMLRAACRFQERADQPQIGNVHRAKNRSSRWSGSDYRTRHLCMQMRAWKKQCGSAVTSAMLGAFSPQ